MDARQLAGIKAYVRQIKDRNYGNVFPAHFEKDMKWLVQACELLIKEMPSEKVSTDNDSTIRGRKGG